MKTYFIQISSAEQLKKLVDVVNQYSCDVNLWNDLGCVDCKSLLDVLRMGISKNMKLDVIGEDVDIQKLIHSLSDVFDIVPKEGK